MTTYYNGIPFTQSGDLYTSSNCQINSAYFQVSNCTSLNDCASLCTLAKQPFTTLANSQNNYMCAAFTYDPHVQGCFLYDRSISTLSVISNSMYCGFILTNNRYCTDNSQRINCNTPDLSSKSVNSQTTAYQGFAFTLNNKFYTAQDVVINEQHYAYGAAKSENDCMEQCQNMFDCTGYDYVLKGSDQGYCYMFDRSISDLSLAANPDKNTGFLLSRIPDCYNDGKTIACATQQPIPSNSINSTVPTASPTLSSSNTSNPTALILEIVIPLAVVVVILLCVIIYCQAKLVTTKEKFATSDKDDSRFLSGSQYSGSLNGNTYNFERSSLPTDETVITNDEQQYLASNTPSLLLFPSPQPPRIDFGQQHDNEITVYRSTLANTYKNADHQPPLLLKDKL